jgi:hypothetical protein
MIPRRYQATCLFCEMELDIRRPGVFAYTEGWVKNRTQGGGNAITLPKRTGSYACGPCVEIATHGDRSLQGALF